MRTCPCDLGQLGHAYAACCGPFHRGEREAPDPTSLMRSRFAAFVVRDTAYLWRTLHADHDDRARAEADVLRDLQRASRENRYLGLTILAATPADGDGVATVTFRARVFRAGKDLSFTERSLFLHDGVGWRYLAGDAAEG